MTGENISKYYNVDRKDTPIQKWEVRNKRPKITNYDFRWFYMHVTPFHECLR